MQTAAQPINDAGPRSEQDMARAPRPKSKIPNILFGLAIVIGLITLVLQLFTDIFKQVPEAYRTPAEPKVRAETLLGPLNIAGFPITLTNSMLSCALIVLGLIILSKIALSKNELVPHGLQNFVEWVIESMLTLTEGTAGKDLGRKIFKLIGTLFVFIISANWLSLLPGFGTIGFLNDEHEFIPFMRAANADLNMTIGMALIAIVTVQYVGIKSHGINHIKGLIYPNPLEIVSEGSRLISLSCRLFGNVFAGDVLLIVIAKLAPPALVLFLGMEVLFGYIQALVFSFLTLVYIYLAAAGHGGHADEAHGHSTMDDHEALPFTDVVEHATPATAH